MSIRTVLGFLCPLLLAGCLSPQHHGPRADSSDGGSNHVSDLEGALSVEFRSDKHIINTDRGLVLIVDADTGCDVVSASVSATRQWPNLLDEAWIDWRHDADMCEFGSAEPVAIPLREQATVAFVGYNIDYREPSIFSCKQDASTDALQLVGYIMEGFDPYAPGRCLSVSERCGGRCEVDTEIR